jgi:predicted MFS family arabinose efflux permease
MIALLFVGSFAGFQFLATLYFQELRGWSTVQTGLAMAVIGVDAILAPVLTPRLVGRFGIARVVFGGVLLAVIAYALFLPTDLDRTYAAMFPAMLLLGVAFALVYGPLTIAGTEGIAAEDQGLASGLLYTAFQFGFALGISAVTAVNVAAVTAGDSGIDALCTALIVPVVTAAVAGAVAVFGLRRTTTDAVPEQDSSPDLARI